ncbi:MAG: hypothetical protein SVY41_02035 [Candidatus Nanohaloarchaea archaeon]|nr:hypothetical protein [Candidatus Nanohaloarchaea archaeon]
MTRSGVSALLSVVVVIAIVLAMAALLLGWATTFFQQQTESVGNESAEQIDCTFGQLGIFSVSSSDGSNTSWASVAVENEGRVGFNNTSVAAVAADGTVLDRGYIEDLAAGDILSQNVSWGNQDASVDAVGGDTVRVGTFSCPTVTAEVDIG